jgi:hypothetical protein
MVKDADPVSEDPEEELPSLPPPQPDMSIIREIQNT